MAVSVPRAGVYAKVSWPFEPLLRRYASETRLAEDRPVTCIVTILQRSRGASESSETRTTLRSRYGFVQAGCLDLVKRRGFSNEKAEEYLTEVLRAKSLWPTQIGFRVAERKWREYFKAHNLQKSAEKRKSLRDRNGRLVLGQSDKEAIERLCDLLKILEIALLRSTDLDLGRNSLGSVNIREGEPPSVERTSEMLLGTENAQRAQRLRPSDILNVAIQGHVNPASLWLDLLAYGDLFGLAVFMGRVVGGQQVECNAAVAATYLADVKRAWSPTLCDPRAVQDRVWYARELRELLDQPAYALARDRLEHAVVTIPKREMRETLPPRGEEVLYALA